MNLLQIVRQAVSLGAGRARFLRIQIPGHDALDLAAYVSPSVRVDLGR